MNARITVAALLLAIAACAPRPGVQSTPSAPMPMPTLQTSALTPAIFESSDADPWRFCLVGTKDCAALSEFGTCLLSTGRCNSDAHIENAGAKIRLQLESPVTGGTNPEIIVPIDR